MTTTLPAPVSAPLPAPVTVAVYYSRGRGPWRKIGDIPRAECYRWLPYSAQTGERVGDLVAAPEGPSRDIVRIWDYTLHGLHWPDCWGRNYSPAE